MKTYLDVPYAEKDRAKALGARFDMSRKQWYCPDGVDLMLFKRWFTFSTKSRARPNGSNHRKQQQQ